MNLSFLKTFLICVLRLLFAQLKRKYTQYIFYRWDWFSWSLCFFCCCCPSCILQLCCALFLSFCHSSCPSIFRSFAHYLHTLCFASHHQNFNVLVLTFFCLDLLEFFHSIILFLFSFWYSHLIVAVCSSTQTINSIRMVCVCACVWFRFVLFLGVTMRKFFMRKRKIVCLYIWRVLLPWHEICTRLSLERACWCMHIRV